MTSYQYLWGCSNTHRNRKSDIYVNSKENLFQLKVNLEGVPRARMKMMSLHVTQEHWGATITSMDVCIPISSKDPQGIPACLESDPPFLEWVQTVVQWHLREISRTAGFLVRLAGFKWKLSISAKWWPDTRTDFPISGMPHLMAGYDFLVSVCACSTCMLSHLKAAVMPLQGACCPRWTKRESGSLLLARPAEAVSSFPQLKITVLQVLRKGLSEPERLPCCPPVSCETRVISSRCCFSAFPSAESVQKSLLLVSQDSPEIENTTKSHCGFVIPPSTSGRKSCPWARRDLCYTHYGPYSRFTMDLTARTRASY